MTMIETRAALRGAGAGTGADQPTVVHAAAFFDIDKTVVSIAAMVAYARPLQRAGYIGPRLVASAAWHHLRFKAGPTGPERMARLRAKGMEIVTGWDAAEVRRIVAEHLPDVLAPKLYGEALALFDLHRRAGREVWLVSAEPREIVEPLGEYLGMDGCIGSDAVVDTDGRYTGETTSWTYGEAKADAIRALADERGFDLSSCFAYSDAHSDVPMLAAVGRPHCVNPDRLLARHAAAHGWPVLRFSRPRPARRNRPAAIHRG